MILRNWISGMRPVFAGSKVLQIWQLAIGNKDEDEDMAIGNEDEDKATGNDDDNYDGGDEVLLKDSQQGGLIRVSSTLARDQAEIFVERERGLP